MNSRILLLLLLLILWIILGLFLCNKFLCGASVAAPVAAAAAPAVISDDCDITWSVRDGSLFNSGKVDRNFRFRSSSFTLPTSLDLDLSAAVNNISDHLSANNERGLTITGYYDGDETNRSILDNLGVARANSIKKLFTDKGIASNRINIASRIAEDKCYRNDTLLTGAALAFGDIANNDTRLAAIKDRLFGKPITLYFATDSDNLTLSAQQRTDFTDLIYYLDNVSGASLGVDGHTDSVGNRDYNVNLSRERADFAKNYLQRNGGISLARMSVNGFGPDKPVQSNNTDAGRAKNRRVEVTLK